MLCCAVSVQYQCCKNPPPLSSPNVVVDHDGSLVFFFFCSFLDLFVFACRSSLLVEFDGLLNVVQAGPVAVQVHEHFVPLLEGRVLALYELDLRHA